jgi:ribose 5-phosphate isomerase A
MEQINEIDLYIDGADEITPDLTLLKGRGYDLVREKLLARSAKKFIVIADESKIVENIGDNFLFLLKFNLLHGSLLKIS